LSCQIDRSSLRQLSIVSVVSAAPAGPPARIAVHTDASAIVRMLVFNMTLSLFVADTVPQIDNTFRRMITA
jgi:hypothetical protein